MKPSNFFTYDHIHERIRDPVRSPLVKLVRGRLVVRSVTTGESRLLYVFVLFFSFSGLYLGKMDDSPRALHYLGVSR